VHLSDDVEEGLAVPQGRLSECLFVLLEHGNQPRVVMPRQHPAL
jgi:hypothetical protein